MQTEIRKHLLVLVALTIVSAAIYGGTLTYPFVFDDDHTVVNNENIRHPENILKFFLKPDMLDERHLQIGFYRPFLFASYTLNYLASGLNPLSWRVTNISLHIVNCFLLFLIIQRVLSRAGKDPWPWSLMAVLVFAAHPIQTETVVYNAARSSLLMATMTLAAVLVFTHYLMSGKRIWLALALIFYGLALFTKETALPFAGVFVLLALFGARNREAGPGARTWLPIALFGAAATAFTGLRAILIATAPQRYIFHAGTSPGVFAAHWAAEVSVIPRYLQLILAPVGLSVDHGLPAVTPWLDPFFFLGAAIMITWFYFLVRSLSGNLLLAALLSWPPLCLLTEMVIPIEDKMVEYRLYLALGGGLLLLLYVARGPLTRLNEAARRLALLALAVLVLGLGVASRNRSQVWESNLRLWRDATEKSPGSARPHTSLGIALVEGGNYPEAVTELHKALRIQPDSPEALNGLGNALFALESVAEAKGYYQEAMRLRPGFADPVFNLGRVFLRENNFAAAITSFRTSVNLDPWNAVAFHNLAYALTNVGRMDEALENYQKAAELGSTYADEHYYNLANAYSRRGEFVLASKWYREALRVNPRHLDSLLNLADLCLSQQRYDDAIRLGEQALQVDPSNVSALNILGKSTMGRGSAAEAVAYFRRALTINPGSSETRIYLEQAQQLLQ